MKVLVVKMAAAALIVGAVQGLFDLLLGYKAFSVLDVYGIYLMIGGFFAMAVMTVVAGVFLRDALFSAYRISMLALCLGCLLMPFISDGTTYYAGMVIFAGFVNFLATLCALCIEVARNFNVAVSRFAALVFACLFTGQMLGFALGFAVEDYFLSVDLAATTLVVVSVLFVTHGFLFTDLDLVRIGIGEIGAEDAAEGEANAERVLDEADVCDMLVKRYALTPRESDVLPLLLQGRTISRIQEALYISAGTVSTHIRHIYQKTGVADRQGLLDLSEQCRAELYGTGGVALLWPQIRRTRRPRKAKGARKAWSLAYLGEYITLANEGKQLYRSGARTAPDAIDLEQAHCRA